MTTGTRLSARKLPAPPSKSSKLFEAWNSLSKPVRYGLVGGLVLAMLVAGGMSWREQQNQPGKLFPFALTARQCQEVSIALIAMGVPNQVSPTGDNILVAPERQQELLGRLRDRGIPHEDSAARAASPMDSQREQQLRRQRELEERFAENIRGIEGVRDAVVLLAPAEETWQNSNPYSSASIKVVMQEGQELTPVQAYGVRSVVANGCGLDESKITLVDGLGKPLRVAKGGHVEAVQLELQKQFETYLAQKAQEMMDHSYGPGRAHVSVNALFDFSEMEIKKTDVGGPGAGETVTAVQRVSEKFGKNERPPVSSGLGDDDLETLEEQPKKDARYEKIAEAKKVKADEAMVWTIYKTPRVQRLTCAVSVNLKGQEENVRQMLMGALGLDMERGDYVAVVTVPTGPIKGPGYQPPPPPVQGHANPLNPLWALVLVLPGVALAGLWMLGHQVSRKRMLMETAMKSSHPQAALADLKHSKDGASCDPMSYPTQANLTSRLEDLAREKPVQVADRLRTWMNSDTRLN